METETPSETVMKLGEQKNVRLKPTVECSVVGWHPSFKEDTARLCKAFSDESLNEYGLGVTQERLDQMTEVCKDLALFLVVDGRAVGLIAGMMVNNLTNGEPALQECVWYVDKEYRSYGKQLLDAFEDMGKEYGAKSVIMALMYNSMRERLDKFYKRLGYKPFEVQYMKELS